MPPRANGINILAHARRPPLRVRRTRSQISRQSRITHRRATNLHLPGPLVIIPGSDAPLLLGGAYCGIFCNPILFWLGLIAIPPCIVIWIMCWAVPLLLLCGMYPFLCIRVVPCLFQQHKSQLTPLLIPLRKSHSQSRRARILTPLFGTSLASVAAASVQATTVLGGRDATRLCSMMRKRR